MIELSFYCNGTLPIARRLRAKPKEQCHEKHEKNIHNPGRVVARRVLVNSTSWAQTKLDASIFSFDGKDFVRTNTTLMDKGQSATNTKLDPSSAAYKALIAKRSYSGPATVFGQNYQIQLRTADR